MNNIIKKPTNILIAFACLSLMVISFSVAYYFVFFLPAKEKTNNAYQAQIRKLQRETSEIRDSVESIDSSSKQENTQEDVQSAIENKLNEERQNQSNCESTGGEYKGNGMCTFY